MKRGAILLAVLAILFGICLPAQGQPWSGTGTESDPYLIEDANDMQAIGADPNHWDAYFKLMADIDLSGFTGTAFNIIGKSSTKFYGVFDGNGHTISNFTYTSTGTNCIGLFSRPGIWSQIKKLGLEDTNIDAGDGDYVAALVGYNEGTITDCYASGSVTGDSAVGGLVGLNDFDGGKVNNCYATGSATGIDYVGGLAGKNAGMISNCYATASVTGVEDSEYVGGLLGGNYSTITNCYATGSVTGVDYVGGLVGYNSGIVGTSFWDTETSGQSTSSGGTGKTTTQMKQKATFTDWDFVDIWGIEDVQTYPFLKLIYPVGDLNYDRRVDLLDLSILVGNWLEGL